MARDIPSISDSTSYRYPFKELPRRGDLISVHPIATRRPRIGLAWGLNNTGKGVHPQETFQYIDIRSWEILFRELDGDVIRAERSYLYNRYVRQQIHMMEPGPLEDDVQRLYEAINELLPPRPRRDPIKIHAF
jgi:hypothetical protein